MADEPAEAEPEKPTDDDSAAMLLVMEESRRLLVRQEADLDTLRTRTGGLLAASSVVTGLLVGLTDRRLDCFERAMFVVAVVAYVATAVLALVVLVPRSWFLSHDMSDWLGQARTGHYPKPMTVVFHLADDFDRYRGKNSKKLTRLQTCYFSGCILLGVQVIAWAAALI
jgi:hypothetical protein